MTRLIKIPGYKLSKSGKLIKQQGYGLNASARIAQRTSKKVRVTKRSPG